ncbi:hypothetical protein QBC39DRAFT_374994 [Podospora conica]|nr:hypothetical protein QBC39DRAFT_374994 [Schizothecium conicum]
MSDIGDYAEIEALFRSFHYLANFLFVSGIEPYILKELLNNAMDEEAEFALP